MGIKLRLRLLRWNYHVPFLALRAQQVAMVMISARSIDGSITAHTTYADPPPVRLSVCWFARRTVDAMQGRDDRLGWPRRQRVPDVLGLTTGAHEPFVAQPREVLRQRRLAKSWQAIIDLADSEFAADQQAQHAKPLLVRQCAQQTRGSIRVGLHGVGVESEFAVHALACRSGS